MDFDVIDGVPIIRDYRLAQGTESGQYAEWDATAKRWIATAAKGSSWPSIAYARKRFYRTDRGICYERDSTNTYWLPISSDATINIYIDTSLGTDSIDNGFASGASAFKTIAYAITYGIPLINGGNHNTAIAAGTYNEGATITGKLLTGDYSLNFNGARTVTESITASSGVTGTGATPGTVVRSTGTWTVNQVQNKLVKGTSGNNNGVYRVIESNTATTITIVGVWAGAVAANDTFEISDASVTVSGGVTVDDQKSLFVNDISIGSAGTYAINADNGSEAYFTRCAASGKRLIVQNGAFLFYSTGVAGSSNSNGVQVQTRAATTIFQSRIHDWANGSVGVVSLDAGSFAETRNGTVLDGGSTGSRIGMRVTRNSGGTAAFSTTIYTQIKNCFVGLQSDNEGFVFEFASVNFTGCTTNYNLSGYFTAAGAAQSADRAAQGSVTLVAGTATVTLTPPAAFSGTNTYVAIPVQSSLTERFISTNLSGTQFTITSTNAASTLTVYWFAKGT